MTDNIDKEVCICVGAQFIIISEKILAIIPKRGCWQPHASSQPAKRHKGSSTFFLSCTIFPILLSSGCIRSRVDEVQVTIQL